jgi:hypothetical protein
MCEIVNKEAKTAYNEDERIIRNIHCGWMEGSCIHIATLEF